jgi:hypothetical protein
MTCCPAPDPLPRVFIIIMGQSVTRYFIKADDREMPLETVRVYDPNLFLVIGISDRLKRLILSHRIQMLVNEHIIYLALVIQAPVTSKTSQILQGVAGCIII